MSTHVSRVNCINHIRTHANNFRCATCGKFWESEKHLRKHEKIHERTLANSIVVETNENGLFKCSEPSQLPPEGAETSSNKCPECSKTFTNPVAYDQHMRRHRNVSEGRFKCKECGQNMPTKSMLGSHTLMHRRLRQNPDGNFTCVKCDRDFPSWNSLSRHVTSHKRITKNCLYKCKLCEMTYVSLQALVKHRLVSHPGDDFDRESTIVTELPAEDGLSTSATVELKCPECDKTYTDRGKLRVHLNKHNNIRAGRFQCKHCGRKHGTHAELKKHEFSAFSTHKTRHKAFETGRFACQQCEKRFGDNRSLNLHKKKGCEEESTENSDGKSWHIYAHRVVSAGKYKCETCEKCFKGKYALTRHEQNAHQKKIKTEAKQLVIDARKSEAEKVRKVVEKDENGFFKCPDCDKRFKYRLKYIIHARQHIALKEGFYKCKICESAFKSSGERKQHERTHEKTQLQNVGRPVCVDMSRSNSDGRKWHVQVFSM
ncbi:hypothetical protein quinque_015767 [Culex quinquefasciatus]